MDIQTVTTDDLIILSKNKKAFCTSSRNIAEALEKKHKHVLEKIDKLLTDAENNSYMDNGSKVRLVEQFDRRTYIDEKGEERPEYYIKEGGFYRLMNSFADGGKKNEKIFAWKDKFAELFEQMKKLIEQKQEITVNAKNYVPPQEQNKIMIANDTVTFTKNICALFGNKIDKGEVFVATLQFAEKSYNMDLSDVKRLAPPKFENFINATELALQIEKDLQINIRGKGSKKTSTLNKFLEQQGYITKVEKKWTVTTKGEQYGHLTPDNKHGKTFYNIAWSTRFIPIIEVEAKKNLQALI